MLKPVDKEVEISTIKLLKKTGGKSTYHKPTKGLTCKVVVCSDLSSGYKKDRGGQLLLAKMEEYGLETSYEIIPDQADLIHKQIDELSTDLLIFKGGTGVGPHDITPDTVRPLLDATLHGVEEETTKKSATLSH